MPPGGPPQIAALSGAIFAAMSGAAAAQNTASVPSADVKAGERAFEYRAAYAANDDGAPDFFQHRFVYHHSFDDRFKFLGFVQQGESGARDLHFQRASLNVFAQLAESERTGGWDFTLRFQGDIPLEDGRPGRARLGVINSFDFSENWQVRSNIYLAREIGGNRQDGLVLDAREEATWRLGERVRIGAQAFHALNTTAHIGDFNEQRHQIGPLIRWKASRNLKIDANVLLGVSRAAADADFRVFATYGF